jgi:hypothetical protein
VSSAVHLPCRCGAERGELDIGSGRCAACRRKSGEVTTAELHAAVARLDRSQGGQRPPVRWQTRKAPRWLWHSCPPDKEQPVRVVMLQIDEWPA